MCLWIKKDWANYFDVNLGRVAAFCIVSIEQKRAVFRRCVRRNWIVGGGNKSENATIVRGTREDATNLRRNATILR